MNRIWLIITTCCAALCMSAIGVAQVKSATTDLLSAGPLAANAALIETSLESRDIDGLGEKLRQIVVAAVKRSDGQTDDYEIVINDPLVRASLVQQELIRRVGEDIIADIAGQKDGVKFLTAFLEDPSWVEAFIVSNFENASYGLAGVPFYKALNNLYLLFQHGKDLDKPIYRRLATALALRTRLSPYMLVRRFQQIQDSHRQGLLHASFDTLDVWEMEWVVYAGYTANDDKDLARDYNFLVNHRLQKVSEHREAWRACWWLDEGVYGESPQGPNFYAPFEHVFGPMEAVFILGGQCENISRYGWAAGQTHGLMASLGGQPAHCCHMFRVGKHWPISYDCAGPAVTDFNIPNWDGTHYASANWLCEQVQQDRVAYLTANRLAMLGKLLREQECARIKILPGLKYSLYRRNVGDRLPDFSKLEPDETGSAKRFDLLGFRLKPPYNYAVVWNGKINVSKTSRVHILLNADDHARVWIDGQMVIESYNSRQIKDINLKSGDHAVRVEFCQGYVNEGLVLEFNGAGKLGKWKRAYAAAFKTQPLNYLIWLDCIKDLENTTDVSPKVWLNFARVGAKAFHAYHETGWALVRRAVENTLPKISANERLDFFVQCHDILRQTNAIEYDDYHLGNVLNWQADQIGDLALQKKFFEKIMRIHTAASPNNQVFGMVLEWGSHRFAQGDQSMRRWFVNIIDDSFRRQGNGACKDLIRKQIGYGIHTAAERSDFQLSRTWLKLGNDLLPRLCPSDVRLAPEQARVFPKIDPFPGRLLSSDGLLRISSRHAEDAPLSYAALLNGSGVGGFFHTNPEINPWAQVQLPGNAVISGIELVNRFEMCSDRQIPLKVSVSSDGKQWVEVATFTQVDKTYRVDLRNKNIQAQFVRVERPAQAGRNDYFHLRGILIYGKKLY